MLTFNIKNIQSLIFIKIIYADMELDNYKDNANENQSHNLISKIRKNTAARFIAMALCIPSVASSISSCNRDKSPELYPNIEILAKNGKVDITGWNKKIHMEWNTLKIWDEVVAKRDKDCQIRIEYKDDQTLNKMNLEWRFLEKPWKIYIYLMPNIDPTLVPNEELEAVKDSLVLYTTQESIVSWLNELKQIDFEVGKPINLMNYIKLNNVSLEKITITYPNQQETEIDNPNIFIPELPWKWLILKIYVSKKWKTSKCITEIDIDPEKRDPIWPTLESISKEEILSNINEHLWNNDIYFIGENFVAEGYQMINSMLHNGTSKLSPKEYKDHLDKIVIALPWDIQTSEHETTSWKSSIIQNKETSNWEDIIKALIPHAKLKNIEDDDNNTWVKKITNYAHTHPEEIIICCHPNNNKEKDENSEFNYEKNIDELNKLDNIIILPHWEYSNPWYIALIWMIAQLNPNIENAKNLESIINSNTAHKTINSHWDDSESLSLPNVLWIIKNSLMPKILSLRISLLDDTNKKYKLEKWEYPFVIFDIPWAMVEYKWNLIPYNSKNWYILNKLNLSKCNRFLDKEELKRLWYNSWDFIRWKIILLDENWKKLNISASISIELK